MLPRPLLVLWLSLLLASTSSAKEIVIFDTDSAYFNDDGAALAMLLKRPAQVEILGVTVVSGNEWLSQGAEYLLHLLEYTGNAAIPVHLGAELPLVNSPERWESFRELWGVGYSGAFGKARPEKGADLAPPHGGKFSAKRPEPQDAVSFLVETIRRRPGEITVFAAGPMTNLALAIRRAPDLPKKIKRLVLMGGAALVPGNTTPAAEFNFWFDPEAAQIVLGSEIPQKLMFGLDVTNKVQLSEERFKRIIARDAPLTRHLRDDLMRYPGFLTERRIKDWTYIWDCLTAAYLLEPGIFGPPKPAWVAVDTTFGPSYGRSDVSLKPNGKLRKPIEMILDVDPAAMLDLFESLLAGSVDAK